MELLHMFKSKNGSLAKIFHNYRYYHKYSKECNFLYFLSFLKRTMKEISFEKHSYEMDAMQAVA